MLLTCAMLVPIEAIYNAARQKRSDAPNLMYTAGRSQSPIDVKRSSAVAEATPDLQTNK